VLYRHVSADRGRHAGRRPRQHETAVEKGSSRQGEAGQDGPGERSEVEGRRIEHVFRAVESYGAVHPHRWHRSACTNIGPVNLVYNLKRLVLLERWAILAEAKQ
jgi:hypothetical protein